MPESREKELVKKILQRLSLQKAYTETLDRYEGAKITNDYKWMSGQLATAYSYSLQIKNMNYDLVRLYTKVSLEETAISDEDINDFRDEVATYGMPKYWTNMVAREVNAPTDKVGEFTKDVLTAGNEAYRAASLLPVLMLNSYYRNTLTSTEKVKAITAIRLSGLGENVEDLTQEEIGNINNRKDKIRYEIESRNFTPALVRDIEDLRSYCEAIVLRTNNLRVLENVCDYASKALLEMPSHVFLKQERYYKPKIIDGHYEDWSVEERVYLDTDGPECDNAPGQDIKEVYIAQDDTFVYIRYILNGPLDETYGYKFGATPHTYVGQIGGKGYIFYAWPSSAIHLPDSYVAVTDNQFEAKFLKEDVKIWNDQIISAWSDQGSETVCRDHVVLPQVDVLLSSNQPPIADPNGPYSGAKGIPIAFDGSGSTDPDGTIESYDWDYGDGTTGTSVTPSHTYAATGTYTVTLTVVDDEGAQSAPATTTAVILVINQSPYCSEAAPSAILLWPPNHNFVPIDILGVADPDGDTVTITIDSIFQDEAVDAKGSGNTAPDGEGVGTSTAEVRAERSGKGDGRVYHIGFTAEDGYGGICVGEVTVGVPHDQGQGAIPIDGGALYDSTVVP